MKFKEVEDFGSLKHKGQVRKFDNKPYFTHPVRVAKTIKTHTKDNDIIIASYLHDTLEDTDTTEKEIESKFGKKVLSLVKELTSNTSQINKMGKAEYLLQKMNKMSSDALLIKLADRLDNVSDFPSAPKKFVEKYDKETKYILSNLKGKVGSQHKKIINDIMKKLI